MNTSELLSLLNQNQEKSLLFEYSKNKFVEANYHITEVKNITVDAVDCGAGTDYWKETVVQLWESPDEIGKQDFMKVHKAMEILNRVDKMKPMVREAEIKFEYSNPDFHTAQLFVDDYNIDKDALIIQLSIKKTDCKARDTCGVSNILESVNQIESNCAPDSGCC